MCLAKWLIQLNNGRRWRVSDGVLIKVKRLHISELNEYNVNGACIESKIKYTFGAEWTEERTNTHTNNVRLTPKEGIKNITNWKFTVDSQPKMFEKLFFPFLSQKGPKKKWLKQKQKRKISGKCQWWPEFMNKKDVPFQKNLLKMSIVSWFICLDGSRDWKKKTIYSLRIRWIWTFQRLFKAPPTQKETPTSQPASKQTKEVKK